ncbi:glycosyltransferase [Nocardioides sp. J54]|uniref:glycosyltransferase n=1 Tax=Nocardioides sp. J54 TaxID=935866 RepID=UPI0004B7F14F|nr:nucleotide disphospho-sugar-binding domain-containing protein [Nocardioides sp. J54]
MAGRAVGAGPAPPAGPARHDPAIEEVRHDDYLGRTSVASLRRSTRVFVERGRFELDDLRSAITAEAPDVLVVDTNAWGAAAVADAWDPRAAPFDVPPGPVALVTTSSEFQDDGVLVRTALHALDGTDLTVLATMPAGASVTDVPRNARVDEFVPHSQVLPHAAVAVTHGGMGATQRALAAGVPVVVVPFGRDQAEVGRRAERAGAGVLLPRRRLTAPRLRAAVRQARTLQPAAQRLARAMAEEAGAAGAADRLEALVRDWR